MRALRLHELGPPEEKLLLEELPAPTPARGEVLIRLRAASLNRRDAWICRGQYAKIRLPSVLGSDGAGEVTALGEGVDPAWLSRRVVIDAAQNWGPSPRVQGKDFTILGMPTQGTLAEQIAVPVDRVEAIPNNLSFEEAACLPVAGLTAYRSVVTRGELRAGEHVLVTGVGGGVASLALQIAHALGARVSVTSGSDEKLERAKALGATAGVRYDEPQWEKVLVERAGSPPSLIIDGTGGDALSTLVNCVAPAGRIVVYGATLGSPKDLVMARIFFKQIDLRGATMGNHDEFRQLLQLFEQKALRPVIDRVVPLEEAPRAIAAMERTHPMGKVVVRCG